MSGLWASLKGQEEPTTAVVNDDLIEESDPVRGAPIRAPARRVAFKPVNGDAILLDLTNEIVEPMIEELTAMLEQKDEAIAAAFDVSDLLAEDLTPVGGLPGRPRVFKNNAQRQKAYRLRRKFGDLI